MFYLDRRINSLYREYRYDIETQKQTQKEETRKLTERIEKMGLVIA